MSSKTNKSKKDGKSSKSGKCASKPEQTVISMFKKQTDVSGNAKTGDKRKLSKQIQSSELDDDDDDFKIIKVESKSKYFKAGHDDINSAVTNDASNCSSDQQPSRKKSRRLSLRLQNSSKRTLSSADDLRQINKVKDSKVSQKDLGSSQKENVVEAGCSVIVEPNCSGVGAGDSKEQTSDKSGSLKRTGSRSGDKSTKVTLSPSKKLSLLKRRSSSRTTNNANAELKQQSMCLKVSKDDTSNISVIELHDDTDEKSSDSVTDDCCDDDDFIDPAKKRSLKRNMLNIDSSAKKLKTKVAKLKHVKSERKEADVVRSTSKLVSSDSRENSKLLWNQLFQSAKKRDEKKAQKPSKGKKSDKAESTVTSTSENLDENEKEPTTKLNEEGDDNRTKGDGTESNPGSTLESDGRKKVLSLEEQEERGEGDGVEVPAAEAVTTEGEGEVTKYRTPYYLENFQTILTAVLGDEDNYRLFDDSDKNYIEIFNKLSESGQKLYVRLFSRKLTWLPVNKISYPEISTDLTDTLQELVDHGLAMSESNLVDLEQTLKVMSATDLKTLAKSFHINCFGLTKTQVSDALVKKSKQSTVSSMFGGGGKGSGTAMLARAKKLLGRSFRLLDGPRRVFVRVLMLFSVVHSSLEDDQANGGQPQLYQMLLVNMGKVVYPQFSVNKQTSLIKDREGLFRFERAMQYENDLAGFIDKNNWTGAYDIYVEAKDEMEKHLTDDQLVSFDQALPPFLRSCTAGSVLTKVLNQGIEILQRRKDYPAAVALIKKLLEQDVYCADYRGYWWERLALNLETHLKKPLEALEAIGKGLSDAAVKVGHRLALFLRAEKLCTSPNSRYRHRMKEFSHQDVIDAPKQTLEGRVLPHSIPGLRFSFMTEDSYVDGNTEDVTVCGVEELVLSHYRNNGYPEGLHAEGSIISNLFNLYFWDVRYMDVPDAFHSPYQTRPLDFHSELFYQRRKDAIDERLQELEDATEERLHELMADTWNTHNGEMCAGLNWERFKSLEHCQGLVSCIQGKVLAGMMRRYATNPRHTRSGFPDLTLWNTDTKQFKICEVKGPGDRLSHKQILWLDHLLKLGVDAEVCHVKAVAAKKLRPVPATSRCEDSNSQTGN